MALIGQWTLTGTCAGSSGSYTYDIVSVTNGALSVTGKIGNCRFDSGRIDGTRVTMSCSNWLNKVDYEGTLVSPTRMQGTFTQRLWMSACPWVAVKGGTTQEAAEIAGRTPPAPGEFLLKRKKSARPDSKIFAKPEPLDTDQHSASSGQMAPVTTVAASGLYALDAHLDFDILDGASFNPADHTLTLFGHRRQPGANTNRHYLTLLAEALETSRPILSLEWTAASQAQVDHAMAYFADDRNNDAITSRLAKGFDADGRVSRQGAALYNALGVKVSQGMNKYEFNAALLAAAGRSSAADALLPLGAWVEAARRKDIKAVLSALEDLTRVLGDYDFVAEKAARLRAGEMSAEQVMDLVWPRVLAHLANAFGWPEAAYVQKYTDSRHKGMSSDDASSEAMYLIQIDLNTLPRQALDAVMAKRQEIVVPPEVMSAVLGAEPRVYPVVSGMPAHGRLAMTAFNADYFCKKLFDMPELAARVPRYKGYFSWLRERGEHPASEQGHLWISPGDF
jgi:hypothetical protein